ncbi:Insulinase (Peptidase M16) [Gryganskiella cystojenkinii]|nr:Insulinase (Peptidase M16) [Gryganskiella cystojenkinii]
MTIEEHTLPGEYHSSKDGTHFIFDKLIEKPENDEREYRLIRLANEMEVLLIHDSKSDKAAASMNVHVGSSSNPDNIQGLAHFLEHLLFLGTTKYPRDNDYTQYLAQHSGSRNAFTGPENTNFYFDVGRDHIEGALDRFAQFFIAPMFNSDCQERELNAIESEYKLNLQTDLKRLYNLDKHLSSHENPYWKFAVGNVITLRDIPAQEGINVRDEIIKFYHKYYSSNIMKLVILGQALRFPISSVSTHYASKPTAILAHIIGHEGTGSLMSLLKRQGWVTLFSAYSSEVALGHDIFFIKTQLTKEGLLHYEDIIVIIFQYIKMLQEGGVDSDIFEEYKSLTDMKFRYMDQQRAATFVQEIGRSMHKGYAPEQIISGAHLLRDIDPKLVMGYIRELRIDNWKAEVVSTDLSIVPGGAFTETERWYGTEYHLTKVSTALLERLQNLELHPELHLPSRNPYIPTSFDCHRTETLTATLNNPALIKQTPVMRLWHKKDDTFWVPKVNIFFRLFSGFAIATPENMVQTILFVRVVTDTLGEESYGALLAGLSYKLTSNIRGIFLEISGYSDKASVLLEKVLMTIKTQSTTTVDPQQFKRIKEVLDADLKNREQQQVATHALIVTKFLNEERMWQDPELLKALHDVTLETVQAFLPQLLARVHIEGLVHGNLTETQALHAGEIVERVLASKALFPSQQIQGRSVLLPEGFKGTHSRPVPNPAEVNSAIDYYIQFLNQTSPEVVARKTDRILAQLMTQIMEEPSFSQLRTIEQLGYGVYCLFRTSGSNVGLSITMFSARDPVYLEQRIEEFLKGRFAQLLETMTEDVLQKHARSLVQNKLEKAKNLTQETEKYWKHISSGDYDFSQDQEEAAEMEKISLDQVRQFFEERVLPSASRCTKLSVHMRSQKVADEKLELTPGTVLIKEVEELKAGLKLSGTLVPVQDLNCFVR